MKFYSGVVIRIYFLKKTFLWLENDDVFSFDTILDIACNGECIHNILDTLVVFIKNTVKMEVAFACIGKRESYIVGSCQNRGDIL